MVVRQEKVAVVDEVKSRVGECDATLLTEYRGLTVAQMQDLRRELKASGTDYKVFKNTLVRRVLSEQEVVGLDESLIGPTAIAFVKGDAAAAAKVLKTFAKANPALVLKGGLLGDRVISAADTNALAELPSREAVLGQLAGLLAQPMTGFAGALSALPRNFAYGLSALVEKSGASKA